EVEALLPGAATLVAGAPLPQVASAPAASPSGTTPSSRGARPPAPDAVIIQPSPSGFAVQLGAFASSANAQSFVEHVKNQVATAEVEPRVRQVDGLFRVYVGPYADRDEARRVAERLERAFGFATTLTP